MGRAGWVAGLATVALAVGTGVAVGQSGGSHPATVPAGSVTLTSCHILLPADGYPRAEQSSHHACIGIERVSVDSRGWVVITATDSSPVITVQVTANEYAASRGLLVGASGGSPTIRVPVVDTTTGTTLNVRWSGHRARFGTSSGFWVHVTRDAS